MSTDVIDRLFVFLVQIVHLEPETMYYYEVSTCAYIMYGAALLVFR